MRYRPEIDGLRAVAVIPVIFFHGGAGLFPGGFVGVDVFFAISGYLITTIIISEVHAGRFSLVNFYERRARRILPALFLVLLVTAPFAWLWLLPPDFARFSRDLLGVVLFSSNFLLWQQAGYFSPVAELNPLLHTWSLAVEEQYYLLFPPVLAIILARGRRAVWIALTSLGISSLLISWWSAEHYPDAGFYLLPSRLWELLVGSVCALALWQRRSTDGFRVSDAFSELVSALGLALILVAMIRFDESTPFPGLYALVPVLGTALIILFCREQSRMGRLLRNPPMVFVGLISYSAYLWHQPVFALARIRTEDELDFLEILVLALVSIGLAVLSWRFVETPFRDKARFSRRKIFRWSFTGITGFAILAVAGFSTQGFSSLRYTEAQMALLSYASYDRTSAYREGECFLERRQSWEAFQPGCGLIDVHDGGLLIWGDSHAAALSSGMRDASEELIQLTASDCLPFLGPSPPTAPHCREINEYILRAVEELKPAIVLLHANWNSAGTSRIRHRLPEVIRRVQMASPESRVAVVGGVPQWQGGLPALVLRSGGGHGPGERLVAPMLNELRQTDRMVRLAAESNAAEFYSLLDIWCNPTECMSTVADNGSVVPVAWDYGHLTYPASRELAHQLLAQLENEVPRD